MRLFRRPTRETAEVPKISVDEVRQRLQRGENLLPLDVRQPGAYAEYPGAIPGSLRIPPAELPDRYREIPREPIVVAYCTCLHQSTGARAAQYLRFHGFPNVRVLEGGYGAWIDAGYPVEDTQRERRLE